MIRDPNARLETTASRCTSGAMIYGRRADVEQRHEGKRLARHPESFHWRCTNLRGTSGRCREIHWHGAGNVLLKLLGSIALSSTPLLPFLLLCWCNSSNHFEFVDVSDGGWPYYLAELDRGPRNSLVTARGVWVSSTKSVAGSSSRRPPPPEISRYRRLRSLCPRGPFVGVFHVSDVRQFASPASRRLNV